MFKHTKGVYRCNKGECVIIADNKIIANTFDAPELTRETKEANAKHIVKCLNMHNELLRSLKSLVNCADLNLECLEHETISLIEEAEEIIKEAEGE